MQGRVRWYDPLSRRGWLATGDGEAYSFALPESADDIGGGDVVEFQPRIDTEPPQAVEVQVRQKGADYLNAAQRNLVNQFLSTITIER